MAWDQVRGLMSVGASSLGTMAATVTIARGAASAFARLSHRQAEARAGRAAFGLDRPHARVYRHDSVHSLYAQSPLLHPDNLSALGTLGGYDYLRAARAGSVMVEDTAVGPLDGDLYLIGAPTSEGLSRAVFGYFPDSEGPDSLSIDNPPLELPFRWVLSLSSVDPTHTAARFVAGKGRVERVNCRIAGPEGPFVPDVGDDGFLTSDYLLVTRLRNYLSTRLDRYVTSVAGLHGTGTRAIELLLRDTTALRRLGRALPGPDASYQALFRVSDISHVPGGTRARSIDFVTAVPLPVTDEDWQDAHDRAMANLKRAYDAGPDL
ncbi:MAG: hypothetical protein KQH57_12975 [Actinomycetales bacterium]|nr:hypothetical protein [Actinomycetales bacterium]